MTNTNTVFGITGMPGSGKSVITKLLNSFGVKIESDKIGHEILKSNDVINELVTVFGDGILDNKKIDRKALASVAFDPIQIQTLNKICHPKIKMIISEKIKEELPLGAFYIIEIPLLFESGFDDICDFTICVDTDFETRLNRVKLQRNWSENELRKRDSCQNEDLKKNTSDFLINGARSLKYIEKELNHLVIAFRYHSTLWLNEKKTVESIKEFYEKLSWDSTLLKFNEYANR